MRCPTCFSSDLRRSRLRSSDFPALAVGRFPLRCRVCRSRFFAWLPQIHFSRRMEPDKERTTAEPFESAKSERFGARFLSVAGRTSRHRKQ